MYSIWTDHELLRGLAGLRLSYCGCTHDGEADNVTANYTFPFSRSAQKLAGYFLSNKHTYMHTLTPRSFPFMRHNRVKPGGDSIVSSHFVVHVDPRPRGLGPRGQPARTCA